MQYKVEAEFVICGMTLMESKMPKFTIRPGIALDESMCSRFKFNLFQSITLHRAVPICHIVLLDIAFRDPQNFNMYLLVFRSVDISLFFKVAKRLFIIKYSKI